MRCPICDWSPDSPESLFTSGLSLPPVYLREIRVVNGEIVCSCFSREDDVDYLVGYEDDENDFSEVK